MTKEYYQQNRERILARMKASYVKNREGILARQKVYRAAHPLKTVWEGMMRRCGHIKGGSAKDLAHYASRGIAVCEEWRHFKPFEEWCLANGYAPGLELDRIDNDKGYCPGNCRFVTHNENLLNKRNTILAAGIPLKTWYDAYKVKMDELGLSYAVVRERFKKLGWTLEKALFTPPSEDTQDLPDDWYEHDGAQRGAVLLGPTLSIRKNP